MLDSTIHKKIQEMVEGDQDLRETISYLRSNGIGVADSIRVLRDYMKINVGEAQACIWLSRIWADIYNNSDEQAEAIQRRIREQYPNILKYFKG